jgi:hypothetical protein
MEDRVMAVMIRLEAVLEAMELPREWESFLDPETGEIVSVSEEDRFDLETDEPDLVELPDWQQESVLRIRRVLDSGRALRLPDSFDIHEWDLMRQFSEARGDMDQRRELLDAIHGAGAFRMFKTTTAQLGLREDWFEFRAAEVRRMAREWLEVNEIPFIDAGGHRE